MTEHQTQTCPTILTCGRSRGPSAWTLCLTTRAPLPWRTRLAAVRPRVTRCSSGWSPCSTRPDRYHCTLTCSKSDGVVTHSPLKEIATLMYLFKWHKHSLQYKCFRCFFCSTITFTTDLLIKRKTPKLIP